MPAANWNPLISVVVNLAALPVAAGSFVMLILCDKAAGNTLGGVRAKSYTSNEEIQADAANLSTVVENMGAVCFAQNNRPSKIWVGNVDTGAAETYAQGLDACLTVIQAAGDYLFAVVADVATTTVILSVAGYVETAAQKMLYVARSSDSGFLTGTFPAALSAIAGDKCTALIYHDVSTAYPDAALAADRLAFNVDTAAPPWQGQLKSVAALSTALTTAQLTNLQTHKVCVGLPFANIPVWLSKGYTLEGRFIEEIVAAAWLETRLTAALQSLLIRETTAGKKIPVNSEGQIQCMAVMNPVFLQGQNIGHLSRTTTYTLTPNTITSADILAAELRFTATAYTADGIREIALTVYLKQEGT